MIHQDTTLPAHVLTDELLGKHLGILGTTGSGKSCAVVLLLRAILDKHPNAHVVMLDPITNTPQLSATALKCWIRTR